MLRNQLMKRFLPATQQRFIHHQPILFNKNTNVFRQGKIMGKLFGNRISGSRKRWFPSSTNSTQEASNNIIYKQSQFGKSPNSGGKNAIRRMTVLNKLFMKHITDLMATGEISEIILGKGLQVSRVKISEDFAYVNVFWLSTGELSNDAFLEHELQRCSGLLRHELSQLCLMGVVPRIKFVKDKLYNNMYQVEALLRNMDLSSPEEEEEAEEEKYIKQEIDYLASQAAETLKQDFYGKFNKETVLKENIKSESNETIQHLNSNVPTMRHDVLGLDHKGIMIKILTKMRKSKQAWDQHLQNNTTDFDTKNSAAIPSISFEGLTKINEKVAKAAANSEKFEAFLAKRNEKRNTPERKKFRISDHHIADVNDKDETDYPELVMSSRLRQFYEAEDYLTDDVEESKHK